MDIKLTVCRQLAEGTEYYWGACCTWHEESDIPTAICDTG